MCAPPIVKGVWLMAVISWQLFGYDDDDDAQSLPLVPPICAKNKHGKILQKWGRSGTEMLHRMLLFQSMLYNTFSSIFIIIQLA